jgi:hypothetical protein
MSGEIIDFNRHREYQRARLYREQPVPRPALHSMALGRGSKGTQPATIALVGRFELVERHIKRIAILLDELRGFAGTCDALPPETAKRAGLLMDRAADVLQGWAAIQGEATEGEDADPQPELDNEKMERMYRRLSPDF